MEHDKAERIRIHCGPANWVFLLVALTINVIPWFPVFRSVKVWTELFMFFLLLSLIPFWLAIEYGKSYVLYDAGIDSYFFGIKYNQIKWKEITRVQVLRTGNRDGARGFLLTLQGGMICSPLGRKNKLGVSDDSIGDLCIQNKKLILSIMKGKNRFIIADYSNNFSEAYSFIQAKVQYQFDQGSFYD